MVKVKDGFKSYWCDMHPFIQRTLAAEKGGVALKMIKRSEITIRTKILWSALTKEEKEPFAERDNR